MKSLKKIVLFFVIALIPFAGTGAQQRGKKKKAQVTAAHKTLKHTKKATKKKNITQRQPLSQHSTGKKFITGVAVPILKDTTTPKVVTVTSVFKPSLRNAAKINFTAATPVTDTTSIPLIYNIPSQTLFFTYQPVPIKPVALSIDSTLPWTHHQYVKIGYGNYATPYIEAGFAFGDEKNAAITLHGKYTSSKGNILYQEFTKAGLDATGVFNLSENNELTGRLFYQNSNQYKYGFTGSTTYSKEQLQQQFNTIGGEFGLQSKKANEYGITYHPQIKIASFFDNKQASELNVIAIAPVNKAFGKLLSFDLSATANITSLHVPSFSIKNNLFYLDPSVIFKTPNLRLNAGIQPSWDNTAFSLLPNITTEAKIVEDKFILIAGWIGYYHKNSYQSLTGINPWIEQPISLLNTKFAEQYAGFKGSTGKHFTYQTKLSFLKINNQPLFVNLANLPNLHNTQTFETLYEPELQAVRLHGELGYAEQEKFSFIAGIDYTQYTKQSLYNKPWGLLPLDVTGSLRYRITKNFQLRSDLFLWDGAQYRDPNTLASQKQGAAADMNAGAEFTIRPRLNLWIQFNNLFNNRYQRWNQYEVLGFNVLGGVVYSFR